MNQTFRPRLARYVCISLAVLLIVAMFALFAVTPSFGMYQWGTTDYVGTVIFVSLFLYLLWIEYQVRLEVFDDGIYIKNLFRSHSFDWSELVGVDFGDGPWVRVDTTHGTTVNVMAIQSADGDYARKEAVRLATLIDMNSPTTNGQAHDHDSGNEPQDSTGAPGTGDHTPDRSKPGDETAGDDPASDDPGSTAL